MRFNSHSHCIQDMLINTVKIGEDLTQETQRPILPFCILSHDRAEPFLKEAKKEIAEIERSRDATVQILKKEIDGMKKIGMRWVQEKATESTYTRFRLQEIVSISTE